MVGGLPWKGNDPDEGAGGFAMVPAASGDQGPMTRAEKAQKIQQILRDLYPEPPIPLRHDDPFSLLVAVLLSAQTTDERVNLVTPGLFAEAPTPADMVELGEARILEHVRSCGLAPQKARNIHRLSQMLVEQGGGAVPDDFEGLEALPGVGHKTAGVVMAQAFGRDAFPVDTHIHRLAARWGLSNESSVERTERDLKALFPPETWSWLHLAIIYFGRDHCPARGHDLQTCPICGWAATRKRMAEEARAGGGGPSSRAVTKSARPKSGAKRAAASKTKPSPSNEKPSPSNEKPSQKEKKAARRKKV